MASFKLLGTSVVMVLSLLLKVQGSHTVTFDNRCGFGTPQLKANGKTLSTGGTFTSNGPLSAAIAYLQTGSCGDNGEGCTIVETTLLNPTSPGSGWITDISLIPPHTFSVATGFEYSNGCTGGADCTDANCKTALHKPGDTGVQVVCQANSTNLVITFCD